MYYVKLLFLVALYAVFTIILASCRPETPATRQAYCIDDCDYACDVTQRLIQCEACLDACRKIGAEQ